MNLSVALLAACFLVFFFFPDSVASRSLIKVRRHNVQRSQHQKCLAHVGSAHSAVHHVTNSHASVTTSHATSTKTGVAASPTPVNLNSGVINVKSSCGPIGATRSISSLSGPNGSIDWLDCGIDSNGWTPPNVTVHDLVTVDLATTLKNSSSPFRNCKAYVPFFEQSSREFNIPSILLASFAMQESSCNPQSIGQGGEQGLMQITSDKCGGAPNGDCKDPAFNIRAGASFFAGQLKHNQGNVLLSIGQYNGWVQGLTVAKATAARNSNCCRCQNNLDYIHQFLNGWMQNVDPGQFRLGKYFNLRVCS